MTRLTGSPEWKSLDRDQWAGSDGVILAWTGSNLIWAQAQKKKKHSQREELVKVGTKFFRRLFRFMSPLYMTRFHYVLSPSSLHDVLVDEAVAEDVFVEELIGEEHQQRGHRLEQDAVGDVAAG